MINRKHFFDAVRPMHGDKLSSKQVVNYSVLLNEWEAKWSDLPIEYFAYMLATLHHECAKTVEPITEFGPKTYFAKYGKGTLAKLLGNTALADGYAFRGRGWVQLTGRRNYYVASKKIGVNLVANPDLALDPTIATKILFNGMTEGWFTTKRLRDYMVKGVFQPVNARRIINGTDKAALIAGYYASFLKALTK